MPKKEILTADEVAELFSITAEQVLCLAQANKIPFFRLEQHVRFRRASLLEWAAELERATLDEAALSGRTLRLFKDTLGFFQESQLSASLIRTLEQLESDRREARLRGIASLEKLAVESEGYRNPAAMVLTTVIRRLSPRREGDGGEPAGADIQAAVASLARLKRLGAETVDLRETDLTGIRATDANLDGMVFSGARLDSAVLAGSSLAGAKLVGTQLIGANLSYANLANAQIEAANLTDANLEGANLAGANLAGAILTRTGLMGANLMGSIGLTNEQLSAAVVDGKTRLPMVTAVAAEPEPFNPFKTAQGIEQPTTQTLGVKEAIEILKSPPVTSFLASGSIAPAPPPKGGKKD